MALIKEVIQPTQFVTTYNNIQRLISLVFGDEGASCEMRLGMYRDEAARKGNATPIQKDVRFSIDRSKAGMLKKVLYEALRGASENDDEMGSQEISFADAEDHVETTDPDLTNLVTYLKDWEVKILLARAQQEMAARELNPLTEAEIQAYYDATG